MPHKIGGENEEADWHAVMFSTQVEMFKNLKTLIKYALVVYFFSFDTSDFNIKRYVTTLWLTAELLKLQQELRTIFLSVWKIFLQNCSTDLVDIKCIFWKMLLWICNVMYILVIRRDSLCTSDVSTSHWSQA